jgi:protein CpxP
MSLKRLTLVAIAVTAAAALAAGATFAQNPAPGPAGPRFGGPGFGPMFALRGLDLTQAQRDQLKTLAQSQREQNAPVFEKLRTLERALRTELLADAPDQGKIDQLKTDLGLAQQDALGARIAMELKVGQILTAEQRQTLRDRLANAPAGPRGRRGWGRGGGAPAGSGR